MKKYLRLLPAILTSLAMNGGSYLIWLNAPYESEVLSILLMVVLVITFTFWAVVVFALLIGWSIFCYNQWTLFWKDKPNK